MKKIAKFVTATLATILLMGTSVLAKPSSGEASKDSTVNVSIEKLDNEIESTLKKSEDNKKEIAKTANDIKSLEKQLKDNDTGIKEREDILRKRVRAAYINGSDGYLQVILESKDLGDFAWRLDAIKKVMDFDNKAIASLNNKKQKINAEKKSLNEKNSKLLVLKSDNEKKLVKLNADKEAQKKLITESKKQQQVYASAVSRTSLSRGSSSVTPSASSNAIVSYAYGFIGTPYLWGGTSPSGFDCSGFTQYVFAKFGIGLGRTTFEQINDGSAVSRDQLQPGDLVLFGSSSNPHHVGIYTGNGMYIHAPHTGDSVKVSPLNRSDFLTGRRVK